jgi:two-component system sensor kinase FixL
MKLPRFCVQRNGRRNGRATSVTSVAREKGRGEVLFRAVVEAALDPTEQQAAERRIQDLQAELLHTSRLSVMGQMASTMAHELNQPLTAIMNYLEAARHLLQQDPQSAERVGMLMGRAVAQAERAGEVIRKLRQFVSKGETGRRAESLNKLVEEALALALLGARQSGIHVALDLDRNVIPVLVDSVQIQQVVLNLVRNAVEAMEAVERRELTIATRAIRSENIAEVRIIDSGPGIAPEIADRLFQPFVTTKTAGMGLGLSICREIVEAHQGSLAAVPNPSGGTVFQLILPMPPGELAQEAAGGSCAARRSGCEGSVNLDEKGSPDA